MERSHRVRRFYSSDECENAQLNCAWQHGPAHSVEFPSAQGVNMNNSRLRRRRRSDLGAWTMAKTVLTDPSGRQHIVRIQRFEVRLLRGRGIICTRFAHMLRSISCRCTAFFHLIQQKMIESAFFLWHINTRPQLTFCLQFCLCTAIYEYCDIDLYPTCTIIISIKTA